MKNRVKELRLENHLTQEELAEKVNTTKANISMIENGKRNLTASSLQIFADFFNVSTDYLLGKTVSPNGKLYNVNVADSDGTITKIQWELLDATKGLTIEDMQKINEYIEFLKTRKDK